MTNLSNAFDAKMPPHICNPYVVFVTLLSSPTPSLLPITNFLSWNKNCILKFSMEGGKSS